MIASTNEGGAMSARPPADLMGLLEGDPHGCAVATAIRDQDGDIVDFTLTYLNEAGSRFLDRPRDELTGRTYRQLWPETVTDGTLPLYRRVVQERVTVVRGAGDAVR
jgi:PAS domain-containing protein